MKTARERVNKDMIPGLEKLMLNESAAALRELDRLLSEYCGMIDEYEKDKPQVVTPSMILLRNQCREAGY